MARKGNGNVTLHDVAAAANVSIATVSNYLSGYPHMRPATKERVRKAIDDLGYVANRAARTLKTGRTGLITFSVSDLRQTYFAELAERIIAAARYRGYGVMIESTGLNRGREIDSIATVKRRMTDGLIISPACMGADDAAVFEGTYPLVMLGAQPFEAPCPHILVDNVQAAYDATTHLIKAGCSRIALVGGAEDGVESSRTARVRGYVRALEAAGRPVRRDMIRTVDDWNALGGARAVAALFDDGIRPDGIVACNDHLAIGVMRQLKDLGLSIPGDVRVVGFDNIEDSRFSIPSLTSVDLNADMVAIKAVDSVIDQAMAGGRAEACVEHVPHSLAYRASSPEV